MTNSVFKICPVRGHHSGLAVFIFTTNPTACLFKNTQKHLWSSPFCSCLAVPAPVSFYQCIYCPSSLCIQTTPFMPPLLTLYDCYTPKKPWHLQLCLCQLCFPSLGRDHCFQAIKKGWSHYCLVNFTVADTLLSNNISPFCYTFFIYCLHSSLSLSLSQPVHHHGKSGGDQDWFLLQSHFHLRPICYSYCHSFRHVLYHSNTFVLFCLSCHLSCNASFPPSAVVFFL